MKPTANLGSLLTLALGLFLAACATPRLRPVTYRARIDHVDIPAGDYLSPEKGSQPMTILFLCVEPPRRRGDAKPLRVSMLGWDRPETLGRTGDTVAFEYPGPLPRAGVVTFAELIDYRIVTAR